MATCRKWCLVLVCLVTAAGAVNGEDDEEIVALKALVPSLRVFDLSTMSGSVTLASSNGYCVEDLRGKALDTAPHLITHSTNYTADQADGFPAGTAPYYARGIEPFRLRHLTYEFGFAGRCTYQMYDYVVTHGMSVLSSYGSQAATAPDVKNLTWGVFDWYAYFTSKGWTWGGEWLNEDTRYDYLMDGDLVTDIMGMVWDYDGNSIAMLDLEFGKPIELTYLRAKSWYPSGGTAAEKQAFEDKYYAGWTRLLTAPIEAMHRKGWSSVGVYPQHYSSGYFGLLASYEADRNWNGTPNVSNSWEWNTWARKAVQGQDILYPDQYLFQFSANNAAYQAARLDHDMTYVNSELVRKPVRPYFWPRLHGGGDGHTWWNQQPVPNEDLRAITVMMPFCGADGLAIWEYHGTNNPHVVPPLWVEGYSTYGGITPVPGGCGNSITVQTNFNAWRVGWNTNTTQPTQIKRYHVITVTNVNSSNGMVRFQAMDPATESEWQALSDNRAVYEMHQNDLIPRLRPPSDNVSGLIEGLAMVKPIERLLKHGDVKIDIPSIKQFYDTLAIVRRVRTRQYDIVMTYDPKVIWGSTPRNIVLTNFAGKAGLNLTLPADSQTRIFIIRHNTNAGNVVTGPATAVTKNSAELSGDLSGIGSRTTIVSVCWGRADGGMTRKFWERISSRSNTADGRFSIAVSGLMPGSNYYYRCYATNSGGEIWAAETRQFVAATSNGGHGLTLIVSEGVDDVEEYTNGVMNLESSDLELAYDNAASPPRPCNQIVGLRFRNAGIPAGAVIRSARLQFTACDTNNMDPAGLLIDMEAEDDATVPSSSSFDLSGRLLTGQPVAWSPAAWTTNDQCGLAQRTPELASLLQTVISRPGWQSGNALMFIISGTGCRSAWSANGHGGEAAARLEVEWGSGCEIPVRSASDDVEQYINGEMSLNSSDLELVYDDFVGAPRPCNQSVGLRFAGVPVPPGARVNAAWIQFCSRDSNNLSSTALDIRVADAANPSTFATNAFNVSSRAVLAPVVSWLPENWTATNESAAAQKTPDLSTLVQAAVDRSGWQTSNSMVFVITGSGRRNAWSWDSATNRAPILYVEWDGGTSPVYLERAAADDSEEHLDGVVDQFSGHLDMAFDDHDYEVSVAATEDDAEEFPDGGISLGSSDLELAHEVGFDSNVIAIATLDDDAEEYTNGVMSLDSSDLEFTYDNGTGAPRPCNQTVALRFQGIPVMPGARVQSAWIQFTAKDTNDTDPVTLSISCADLSNAPAISTNTYNLSSLPLLSPGVAWSPARWTSVNQAGSAQKTPDLAPLMQSIVNKSGWRSGNALTFVITGTGRRCAWARDGGTSGVPVLHVVWGVDRTVGVRFRDLWIEQGATVRSAKLQFVAKETNRLDPCSLTIHGVAADNTPVVGTNAFDISSRARVGSPVIWSPSAWNPVDGEGVAERSPELKSLVQSIVNRPGWQSGNALMFVINGSGMRNAWSRDGNNGQTPPVFQLAWGREQVSGVRFERIDIPRRARVESAYIQFTAEESGDSDASFVIRGEKRANAAPFTGTNFNLSARPLTDSAVAWAPGEWSGDGAAGEAQRTPDLSGIVQELVDRPDWQSGAAMAFIISGSGVRSAYSRDGNGGRFPPTLVIRLSPSALGPADEDRDGMADIWEITYFGGTNAVNGGAYQDRDGDGVSNLDEYLTGTSATNASAALELSASLVSNRVVVSYPTLAASGSAYEGANRIYDLQSTTRIRQPSWQNVSGEANIEGDGRQQAYTNFSTTTSLYYRVRARLDASLLDY